MALNGKILAYSFCVFEDNRPSNSGAIGSNDGYKTRILTNNYLIHFRIIPAPNVNFLNIMNSLYADDAKTWYSDFIKHQSGQQILSQLILPIVIPKTFRIKVTDKLLEPYSVSACCQKGKCKLIRLVQSTDPFCIDTECPNSQLIKKTIDLSYNNITNDGDLLLSYENTVDILSGTYPSTSDTSTSCNICKRCKKCDWNTNKLCKKHKVCTHRRGKIQTKTKISRVTLQNNKKISKANLQTILNSL